MYFQLLQAGGISSIAAGVTQFINYVGASAAAAVGLGTAGGVGATWWWTSRNANNVPPPLPAANVQDTANQELAKDIKESLKACTTSTRQTNDTVNEVGTLLDEIKDKMHATETLLLSTGAVIQDLTPILEASNAAVANATPELKAGAAEMERVTNNVIAALRELKEEDPRKIDNLINAITGLAHTCKTSLQEYNGMLKEVIAEKLSLQAALTVHQQICDRQDQNYINLHGTTLQAVELLERDAETEVLQKITQISTSSKNARAQSHSKSSPLHLSKTDPHSLSNQSSASSTPEKDTKKDEEYRRSSPINY